jgi:hypothetical protein
MLHPAKSRDQSRTIHVAGSDLTNYANPPRFDTLTNNFSLLEGKFLFIRF